MSILAQTPPTTVPVVPEEKLGVTAFWLAILLIVALAVAWRMGVLARGSIRGPVRIARRFPLGRLVGVTALGGVAWVFSQVLIVQARAIQFRQANPDATFTVEMLNATDFAVLATLPFVVGIAALLLGDASIRRDVLRRLGLSASKLADGVVIAVAAMFVVMPLMFMMSIVLELIYKAIDYEHPTEHQMLKAMKDAPAYARWLLTIGACVLAPAFEELFFRGHIQTIVARFVRDVRDLSGSRWIAVIFTSLIFAIVHEPWTWPVIFLLAMILGYAYERTGNLWVPIFIHALFNTIQTLIFLYGR